MNEIQAAIKTLAEDSGMTVDMKANTDKLWIGAKTEAQKAVLADTSPHLLHYGGWYTGKKYIGIAKAVQMAQMYPNNRVALICNERVDMKATLWRTLQSEVVNRISASELAEIWTTPFTYEFVNGSRIYGFGLDEDRTRMMAMEFGFALIGDVVNVSEEDYGFICDRTKLQSVHFRQVMAITEPEYDDHYLYREFLKLKQGGYASIKAERMPDCPESFYERMDELNNDDRQRYRDGVWVKRPAKRECWEVSGLGDGKYGVYIRNAEGEIAEVVKEHADLVAAAPDLLEAAEAVDKNVSYHGSRTRCRVDRLAVQSLRDAIAKAKGIDNE